VSLVRLTRDRHRVERGTARRTVDTATVLASMVGFIDAYMINVAVPAIGRDLDAGVSQLQWVLTGRLR